MDDNPIFLMIFFFYLHEHILVFLNDFLVYYQTFDFFIFDVNY